jgi:hypothetical protein
VGQFVTHRESTYEAHTIYANHISNCGYARIHGLVDVSDIYIPSIVSGVLLYSRASSPSTNIPKCESLIGRDACERDVDAVIHLNVEAT